MECHQGGLIRSAQLPSAFQYVCDGAQFCLRDSPPDMARAGSGASLTVVRIGTRRAIPGRRSRFGLMATLSSPFLCEGRCICPSRNAKQRSLTAPHLVSGVILQVWVRQ